MSALDKTKEMALLPDCRAERVIERHKKLTYLLNTHYYCDIYNFFYAYFKIYR